MKTQLLLLTSWLGGALAVTCYQCSKVGWRKHGDYTVVNMSMLRISQCKIISGLCCE